MSNSTCGYNNGMKIVFVSREYLPSRRAGGIATYIFETARYLAKNNHKVWILAASDDISKESEIDEDGIRVIRLCGGDFYIDTKSSVFTKLVSKLRSILCFYTYRKRLADRLNILIRENAVNVIEFCDYGNEMAVWVRDEVKIPWIVRLHGPTSLDRATGDAARFKDSPIIWVFGKMEVRNILKATVISSPSLAQAKQFQHMAKRDLSITVIPNAIHVEDWVCKDVNKHFNTGKNIDIFSAGSIVNEKGYSDLVTACSILRDKGFDIILTLAGKKGRLGEKLEQMSKISESYGWIRIIGPVDRNMLKDYYQSANLVVFPSWWEPFGLVCVEAMAAGALVLGSALGGMNEIIDEGVSGFLVSPKNPLLLAKKIECVLSLPYETNEKIRLAAKIKAGKYDTDNVMSQQVAFYNEIVKKYR